MTINSKTRAAFMLLLTGGLLFIALDAGTAQTGKTPYDKERLLKVVRLNALSTQEVVAAVQQRGVDFQTTAAIEAEFREAGARPELIEALRNNYRPPAPAGATPPSSTMAPSTTKPAGNVPSGPPLSKNEIVTLLQNGVPASRVEHLVEVRGVAFTLTPEISREITGAGGNRSLLGAITEKATTASAAPHSSSTPVRAAKSGPDYDDLTDQAVSALQANNSSQAVRVLQQAIAMDSTRPTAYQLLGYAELYGNRDILAAERSMRAAIERGGAAAFRVYHDHDGFFKTFCQGSFFVTKSRVTFKAADGNHTFEANDADMKETELNGFVGSEYGAFHLKVFRDTSRNKTDNYNFAPATTKRAESTLIVTLIKGYQ
ncbi:MAG TPA: hypothetical protein VJH03_16645 [Blastocatellia bacterium]|nr:hypothetical protein [Blastocatellia bacterium]